ncbi:MAG TPA: PD-(D/E)XK nuclease family protein [Acidimicrobiales bacterium]|nr:PD-(D/E)XK nuclease family protein [Acidimicrobiales bacterium]
MSLTLPRSLSPTRVTSFTACPLAFRLRAIDRLPEPPSPHAMKGTLVHRVLERLIWDHPAGERTPEVATAELARAWAQLRESEEYAELGLDETAAAALLSDAGELVTNYFALEDPTRVEAVGVEVCLEAELDGLRLRGIIDRLDLDATGELIVVDYKTGRAPSERYEKAKLTGVHLYALLCEQTLGKIPVEVRLLHLREPLSITAVPNPQTLRGQRTRTLAVWKAIERACERDDFQPRPSPLCEYCSYQAWCPAFGGVPPVFPAPA